MTFLYFSELDPTMSEMSFDPHRSAELHNQILQHAWTGAGHDIAFLPSTWWEEYSPVDLEPRLTPKFAQFLRSARSTPSRRWTSEDLGFNFQFLIEITRQRPFAPVPAASRNH